MSAALEPITRDEFLAWDAAQSERYEFDGTQPVAMTGGSIPHARLVKRATAALDARLRGGCEAFGGDLRVDIGARIRFPDVVVLCGPPPYAEAGVEAVVVIEVLSPSTALTDRRVKPAEYASVPSVQTYVMLEQAIPRAVVLRRSTGWVEEIVEGLHASVRLPEVGADLPLLALYGS